MKSYFNFITYFFSIIGIISTILISTGTISIKKNKYISLNLAAGVGVLNQESGQVYLLRGGKVYEYDFENNSSTVKEFEEK